MPPPAQAEGGAAPIRGPRTAALGATSPRLGLPPVGGKVCVVATPPGLAEPQYGAQSQPEDKARCERGG